MVVASQVCSASGRSSTQGALPARRWGRHLKPKRRRILAQRSSAASQRKIHRGTHVTWATPRTLPRYCREPAKASRLGTSTRGRQVPQLGTEQHATTRTGTAILKSRTRHYYENVAFAARFSSNCDRLITQPVLIERPAWRRGTERHTATCPESGDLLVQSHTNVGVAETLLHGLRASPMGELSDVPVWRRSWNKIRGGPALVMRRSNHFVGVYGSFGLPGPIRQTDRFAEHIAACSSLFLLPEPPAMIAPVLSTNERPGAAVS